MTDCITCTETGTTTNGECPKSARPCGHHCNHSWTHDCCCYCGAEVDDDGNWPSPEVVG